MKSKSLLSGMAGMIFILFSINSQAAIFTVTTLDDELDPVFNPADLSLREAMVEASNTADSDTIIFDPTLTGSITLSIVGDTTIGASAFGINDTVIVNGDNGNAGIVLDAGATMRHFFVAASGDLTLNSITLRNGLARGGNGGRGSNTVASGGGGAGLGGAVYNRGSLQINASTLAGNLAEGGTGGDNGSTPGSTSTGGSGGGGVQGNGGNGFGGNGIGSGGGGGGTIGNGSVGVSIGAGGAGGIGGSGGTAGGAAIFGAGGAATGAGGGGGGAGAGTGNRPGGSGGDGGVGGGGGGGGGSGSAGGGRGGAGGYGGGGGGGGSRNGAAGGDGGFGGGGGGTGNQTGSLGGLGGFAGGDGGPPGSVASGGGGGGGLGGALFNEVGSITVENSTFSSNSAIGGAGRSNGQPGLGLGSALFTQGGLITLTQSTVAAHPAGVAIYLQDGTGAMLTTNGSIFASSTDGHCGGDPLTVVAENLADDGSCTGVTAGLTGLATTATANGGPTFTHALLAGSEALDAAPSGTSSDQRGFAADGIRDIGAYEAQIPVVMAPTDVNVEATGPLTSPALGTATVTDVDEPTLITATPTQANDFVVGNTVVTWSATDVYGHIGIDTQNVSVVDTTPPILSLIGANAISLTVGDTYIDAGATASDLVDDDAALTDNIAVSNLPNTNAAGTYVISYDVADIAGNTATTITRTVNVLASVGGSLTGLATGNSVEIQNNAGDNLVLNSDGGFSFAMPLALNDAYNVTVLNQPMTPEQTCSVSSGSGVITAGNINSIVINCSTNTYTVGGTVTDLAVGNNVTLQNNAGDDLTVNANGNFTFTTPLEDELTYSVTVLTNPTSPNQVCTVANGSGSLGGSNVSDVTVVCSTNTYTVGGSITGLAAGNVATLQVNTGNDLSINTNGSFTFTTPLADGSAYTVTVSQQPVDQSCVVSNDTGTLAGTDVTDVSVSCVDNSISLSSNSLSYGNVTIGDQSSETITVTNTGSSDVSITDLIDPAAPFSITGGGCTVLPVILSAGESCEIVVLFNPDTAGSFNDSLQIISNASSSPNQVSLSGSSGSAETVPVPTLSQWALILLSLMVVMVGAAVRARPH